jgi:uncharacterized RDD family membrane protein YckC
MYKFCPNCGSEVKVDSNFCSSCGIKTNNDLDVDKVNEYAGLWERFLAYVIDCLVLIAIGFIMGFTIGLLFPNLILTTPEEELEPIFNVIGFIISWIYFAAMESSNWQATFGKRALGLKVTSYDFKKISFGHSSVRFFSKIISILILFIGYIMIAFTEKKQGLHDMLAKTLVIKN